MTPVRLSLAPCGMYGVSGHVGVGHIHSHSGFVQDDSAGFAVAASLLREAVPVDTRVKAVELSPSCNSVTVTTAEGGVGSVEARRGITPAEVEIAQRALGEDAVFTQRTAVRTFGRMYGQGALELPCALQGACALAVMDTFEKRLQGRFVTAEDREAFPGNYDRFGATVVEIGEVPVSLMLVVNGTNGGLGPAEDGEGDTDYGKKGELMRRFALERLPTVIIESKAFIPAISRKINENQYMIRAEKGVDCTPLGMALFAAAQKAGLPSRFEDSILPVSPGSLKKATANFADRIIETAAKLRETDSAADKVAILGELNRLVSEDAGGVTFMSNSVCDVMRGAGTLPGITAILSMVTCPADRDHWKIPLVSDEECAGYCRIIKDTVTTLAAVP